MPKLLALEWNSHEVRVVAAQTRGGGGLVVDEMFAVPLEEDANVGASIAAALSEHKVGKAPVLVALGRASVELKELTLPPAPDEELPEMVRFQSLREFNALGEEWPLDYYPLHDEPGEQRHVLAAAVAPNVVQAVRDACSASGLELTRLLLRPCASSALFLQCERTGDYQARLLIDLLSDEANLTVLVDDTVVFMRTARLPRDMLAHTEECKPLVLEARRTLAAANNQLGGRKVEAVYIMGCSPEHQALLEHMRQDLKLPGEAVDPLAGIELSKRLARNPAEHPPQFAPLLGALMQEAGETAPALDFINPRKPPEPPSNRRKWLLAGAAVAAAALLIVALVRIQFNNLDEQINALQSENDSQPLKASVEEAKRLETKVEEIEAWKTSDIVWLDELAHLSHDLPNARDVMLTELRILTRPDGGEIQIDGLASSPAAIDQLERQLQSERRKVQAKSRQRENKHPIYHWQFGSVVFLDGKAKPPPAPKSKNSVADIGRPPAK